MMSEQLQCYLTEWQLSDPRLLATTATSHVYLVKHDGNQVVLKVLTPYGHEEAVGAAALRHFDGHGAVKLYRSDQNAHLMEYIEDGDLVEMVRHGEDQKATAIIADVLNQLHSKTDQPFPPELTPLTGWFRELFNKAEADGKADTLYTRAAKLARELLNNPRDIRVLHGDIHHENVRYHHERGWLAFDPKGLVGERTYDAANTLCNPVSLPHVVHDEARLLRNAGILADKMQIEFSRLLAFTYAYSALSAAWILSDGADPSYPETVARLIEPHLVGA